MVDLETESWFGNSSFPVIFEYRDARCWLRYDVDTIEYLRVTSQSISLRVTIDCGSDDVTKIYF